MENNTNRFSTEFTETSAIEAFKIYFNQRGFHCFNYDNLETPLRELFLVPHEIGYEMLKTFCKKIGHPEMLNKCVIDFIDDHQFQAYAGSEDGYYFIGISAALPALIEALFHNIFSFTNPFSSLDAEKEMEENEKDEGIEYLFPDNLMFSGFNKKDFLKEIKSLVIDTIPPEKWQRKMAVKMAELAIVFCIAHEIGHLVCGHSDIVKKRGIKYVSEFTVKEKAKTKQLIGQWLSQTLELHADQLGLALLIGYVMGTKKHHKKFMGYLRCKDDLNLYGCMIYAINLVFLLLGQQQYSVKSIGSHPAPIVRITFLISDFAKMMKDFKNYEEDTAMGLIFTYVDMANEAWLKMGFSAGKYFDMKTDLLSVIVQLKRAKEITSKIFISYEWVKLFQFHNEAKY